MSLVDRECSVVVNAYRGRAVRTLMPDSAVARDPMYRRSGSSFDLKCIRSYQPSDDPRAIDWKLYGRTDRAYVKEYFAEENEAIYVLLDVSASMALVDRDDYLRCAASLCWIALSLGVGVTMQPYADGRVAGAVRARGLSGHRSIEDALTRLDFGGGSDLGRAARPLAAKGARRFAILSDFHAPPIGFPPIRGRGPVFLVDYAGDFAAAAPEGRELEILDPESGASITLPWDRGDGDALKRHMKRREADLLAISPTTSLAPRGASPDRTAVYWAFAEALHA